MARPNATEPRRLLPYVSTLALLATAVALFWQAQGRLIAQTAPTIDEVPHLAATVFLLETGEIERNLEHPPAVKRSAAIALELFGFRKWAGANRNALLLDQWLAGDALFKRNFASAQRALNQARWVNVIAAGIGLLVVGWWAFRIGGALGSALSLLLLALSPVFVAHAGLLTMDVALAASAIVATFLLHRWLETGRVTFALAFGIATGWVLTTKFTGTVFATAFGLWIAAAAFRGTLPKTALRDLGLACAAAVAVIFAMYGSLAAPIAYVFGFQQVGGNHLYGQWFMGEYSDDPFALYFPAALALKSSPAMLMALATVAGLAFLRRRAELRPSVSQRHETTVPLGLLTFVGGFFFLVNVAMAPNLGVRYVLPVYPFIAVAAATIVLRGTLGVAAIAVAIPVQIWVWREAWPDPLSYFNDLSTCQGIEAVRCLDDSNLDWGQDLLRAREYAIAQGVEGSHVVWMLMTRLGPASLPGSRSIADSDIKSPCQCLYFMSAHLVQRHYGSLDAFHASTLGRHAKVIPGVGRSLFVVDLTAPAQVSREETRARQ